MRNNLWEIGNSIVDSARLDEIEALVSDRDIAQLALNFQKYFEREKGNFETQSCLVREYFKSHKIHLHNDAIDEIGECVKFGNTQMERLKRVALKLAKLLHSDNLSPYIKKDTEW
eukprot:CAMPEP_0185278606 /NCGR_PEP_ID=MMETSP1359-20130426/61453_1 /TAXON_ID=552665 /ORGANISM="Bigelowiella longifila, Strain CCMP242" /LENGTH=114 /DNA_ID=CAMNT_0027873179 /DNA_START=415 /DNA_END=756 /DNA_ORIENTATION=+